MQMTAAATRTPPRSKRKSRWSKRSRTRRRSRTRPRRWWSKEVVRWRASRTAGAGIQAGRARRKSTEEARPGRRGAAKDDAKKPEPKKAEVKPLTLQKPAHRPNSIPSRWKRCSTSATRRLAAARHLNNATSLAKRRAARRRKSHSASSTRCVSGCAALDPASWSQESRGARGRVQIKLRPDGRLAPGPWLQLVSGNSPLAIAAGKRRPALNRGQPFDMLKPEHYEQWKDIEITFDPRGSGAVTPPTRGDGAHD